MRVLFLTVLSLATQLPEEVVEDPRLTRGGVGQAGATWWPWKEETQKVKGAVEETRAIVADQMDAAAVVKEETQKVEKVVEQTQAIESKLQKWEQELAAQSEELAAQAEQLRQKAAALDAREAALGAREAALDAQAQAREPEPTELELRDTALEVAPDGEPSSYLPKRAHLEDVAIPSLDLHIAEAVGALEDKVEAAAATIGNLLHCLGGNCAPNPVDASEDGAHGPEHTTLLPTSIPAVYQ